MDASRPSTEIHDVVILGAGHAGLSAATTLARAGFDPLVLEKGGSVATSWRGRYENLALNTSRWMSRLPHGAFPCTAKRWPSRDQVIAHLEDYATRSGATIRTGVTVSRIDRDGAAFKVSTKEGTVGAQIVVVALGENRTPVTPGWSGVDVFAGRLMHSADYRNAESFAGQKVVVVGAGESGADIAADLAAGGAEVALSVRSAPHLTPLSVLGVPIDWNARIVELAGPRLADPMVKIMLRAVVGDLSRYGLPRPDDGLYERFLARHRAPIIDAGEFRSALKNGRIRIVPAVVSLKENHAVLADGNRLEVDAVIAATGFHPDLGDVVGHLDVLAETGLPKVHAPEPAIPNLYFLGYRVPFSGNFRRVRIDSIRLARRLRSDRKGASARG